MQPQLAGDSVNLPEVVSSIALGDQPALSGTVTFGVVNQRLRPLFPRTAYA